MRNFAEMKTLILDQAVANDRIRAVLLNGSRANDKIKKDRYQDYDIVYFVSELDSFISNHEWTKVFGEKILWQLPDAMLIENDVPRDAFTYLMVFSDGNRIDLTLFPIDKLESSFEQDSLSKVWLDKDQLFKEIEEASDKDYWIKRPSEQEFQDICNEFWWVSPYVAKGLGRGEIIYAKEMMDSPVRKMLNRIIEINIGIKTNFSLSAGKSGKYFPQYLSKSEYQNLLLTYPNHEIDQIIEAMYRMMDIFSQNALKVASRLQFQYNKEEEENARRYFDWLLSLNA